MASPLARRSRSSVSLRAGRSTALRARRTPAMASPNGGGTRRHDGALQVGEQERQRAGQELHRSTRHELCAGESSGCGRWAGWSRSSRGHRYHVGHDHDAGPGVWSDAEPAPCASPSGADSHRRVEPSSSVNRNVTVPEGAGTPPFSHVATSRCPLSTARDHPRHARRRRPNNRTGLPPHTVWMLGAPDAPFFAAHPRPVARPSADPNLIDCPAEGRGPSSVEAQSAVVRGAE
jgi:hypothetical protein